MTAPARRWPLHGAALLAVALLLALVGRYWHPVYGFTALIQLDAPNDDVKIAAFREYPVYVHRDTGGYDGLYYAQVAYHPLLDAKELAPAIDNLSYRARRILPPALAWLLSAGQPALIVHVYSLLNVAAWLALAVVLWRILAVADFRGWFAWAGVLFSAGALGSVRLALTDLPMLLLLATAVRFSERGHLSGARGWLAAAALARETALLGAAGLISRPWVSRKNFLTALVIAAPLAAWLAYIRWRVGPVDAGWANFTFPVAGLVEKWTAVFHAVRHLDDPLLAWTTALATLALTAQGVFFLSRWSLAEAWWRIGVAYTAVLLTLGTAVWEGYPGAFTRVLLPLTLAFNILAHRTRAALVWLVLGNLGVFAGLLAFSDAAVDSREIFAGRIGGASTLVRLDTGWFGCERHARHTWSWSAGRAQLDVIAWPRAALRTEFQFSLRSLTPRIVVIRQNHLELWRGSVGEKISTFRIPLVLTAGHARLEFSTDTPGAPESIGADARTLAFALYDPRLLAPTP